MRKLQAPTLPVALLIDNPSRHGRLHFEDRWVDLDVRWSLKHSVSVIVLTRGNQVLIDACLRSMVRSVTSNALLEFIVVNNGAPVSVPEPFPFPVRQLREERTFNWSAFNNSAAARASGEFLLFLNDDVEALHGGWLDAMLDEALRPGVGAVGAKLLYPNGMIQHIEVALGLGGEAGHASKFEPRSYPGPQGKYRGPFSAEAVTGACLLTSRAAFDAVHGFDEVFALNYNDVDYCLRLREAGFDVRVTPLAELLHHETVTRQLGASTTEKVRFMVRWGGRVERAQQAHSKGEGGA
jgi:glycosyltransferase involved in cell wall biosynthesis